MILSTEENCWAGTLRWEFARGDMVITRYLGQLHSFDGAPAIQSANLTAYYNRGKLHHASDYAVVMTNMHVKVYFLQDNGVRIDARPCENAKMLKLAKTVHLRFLNDKIYKHSIHMMIERGYHVPAVDYKSVPKFYYNDIFSRIFTIGYDDHLIPRLFYI